MVLRSGLWSAFTKIPFSRLDDVLQHGEHHRFLDKSIGWIRGNPPLLPLGFYRDGWGDPSVPGRFREWISIYAERANRGEGIPRMLDIKESKLEAKNRWLPKVHPPVTLTEASYPTCCHEILTSLPAETRTGHFLLVEPDTYTSDLGMNNNEKPIVVLLAGTGEHGYSRRLQCIALPLAARGIATLILESPFYGIRRPRGQVGSKLRKVSDLPTLGRVTIEETCSLIRWLLEEKGFGPISVGGISMGGLHGAMVASVLPIPVGVVSWLGPPSAAPVFAEGLMSNFCAWTNLEREMKQSNIPEILLANSAKVRGSALSPRLIMAEFLSLTNLDNFPTPVAPEAAVFVSAKHDEYVPREQCRKYWDKILDGKWKGAEYKEIAGGHVSGILFRAHETCDLFQDTFRILSSINKAAFSFPPYIEEADVVANQQGLQDAPH